VSRFATNNAASIAVNNDVHGEPITYTPEPIEGEEAEAIELLAVVYRQPGKAEIRPDPQYRGKIANIDLMISVPQSVITTVNAQGDRVSLKRRPNDTETTEFTVAAVVSSEGGRWLLELR
jgi:hypothetical protein